MTTIAQIRYTLEDLDRKLADKGWRTPHCEFNIDSQIWFYVKAKHPLDGGDPLSYFACGETVEEALLNAESHIAHLPTSEKAAEDDFRKALGSLIDKGNKLGVVPDFMQILQEEMRTLSENIITKQAG